MLVRRHGNRLARVNPSFSRRKRAIRPRTILYTVLWSAIGIGMVVALFMRDQIGLTVAHDRNPLFVTLSDGTIRNAYSLKIQNMTGEPHLFRISAKSKPELRLDISFPPQTGKNL